MIGIGKPCHLCLQYCIFEFKCMYDIRKISVIANNFLHTLRIEGYMALQGFNCLSIEVTLKTYIESYLLAYYSSDQKSPF